MREDWMKILPYTWYFKQKRYPDERICKLKYRFYAWGDHQIEEVHFFETFTQ